MATMDVHTRPRVFSWMQRKHLQVTNDEEVKLFFVQKKAHTFVHNAYVPLHMCKSSQLGTSPFSHG